VRKCLLLFVCYKNNILRCALLRTVASVSASDAAERRSLVVDNVDIVSVIASDLACCELPCHALHGNCGLRFNVPPSVRATGGPRSTRALPASCGGRERGGLSATGPSPACGCSVGECRLCGRGVRTNKELSCAPSRPQVPFVPGREGRSSAPRVWSHNAERLGVSQGSHVVRPSGNKRSGAAARFVAIVAWEAVDPSGAFRIFRFGSTWL